MGYKVSRLHRASDGNGAGMLHFGPYNITTDSGALIDYYGWHPNGNQFLGRLAASLGTSNKELGIIDVGANCGDTAALMRSHAGLPILCVEGDEKLYSLLQKNLVPVPNVTLTKCYLGEKTGPMSVKIEKAGWNNTLVPSTGSDSDVQIIRLDELSHPWLAKRKVGLLKVDTEGFDVPIIFGASKLLAASQPIVAFEYNRENMDAIAEPGLRIFPYLADLGYEGLLTYDSTGRYLLSTTVNEMGLLTELHEFIRPPQCGIAYLDIVAFPKSRTPLFQQFRNAEKSQ